MKAKTCFEQATISPRQRYGQLMAALAREMREENETKEVMKVKESKDREESKVKKGRIGDEIGQASTCPKSEQPDSGTAKGNDNYPGPVVLVEVAGGLVQDVRLLSHASTPIKVIVRDYDLGQNDAGEDQDQEWLLGETEESHVEK
jgi:hypothetical protein